MNALTRNIPNTITCLNIAAGCVAIICASRGQEPLWDLRAFEWAWIFIGIAAVADFFDGFAARALHAYSNLGKELDSLCDAVSFGVAPAIIMFQCMHLLSPSPWVAWTAVLIPVAGVLRLARFNIDDRQTTSFIGLPIPANAIFWIGFSAFCYYGGTWAAQWWIALPLILLVSWLMVSPVRLFSLKFKTWGLRGNVSRWALIVSVPILCAISGAAGLMWVIIFYIILSLCTGDGR